MTEPRLYRRNGGPPEPLPFAAFDAAGDHWTDLARSPEGRQACGFDDGAEPPFFDPATHARRWDAATEAWIVEALPPPPPPSPDDLSAYASTARDARRDGGITLGSMAIATDEKSRGLIDGAYSLSQARPDAPIDFKAASGWVTIDAATMQTVAVAVGTWVQICYSAHRRVDDDIADGAITTFAEIDAAFAAVTLPG